MSSLCGTFTSASSCLAVQCSALDIIRKLLQFQECGSSNSSFCGTIIITGGCALQSEIVALLSQRLDVIQVIMRKTQVTPIIIIFRFITVSYVHGVLCSRH